MRIAEADEAGALRIARDPALEGDIAHFIGGALGRTHRSGLSLAPPL